MNNNYIVISQSGVETIYHFSTEKMKLDTLANLKISMTKKEITHFICLGINSKERMVTINCQNIDYLFFDKE